MFISAFSTVLSLANDSFLVYCHTLLERHDALWCFHYRGLSFIPIEDCLNRYSLEGLMDVGHLAALAEGPICQILRMLQIG